MTDLALGVVGVAKDIVKIGMEFKEVVDTLPQNDKECQDLLKVWAIMMPILSQLKDVELTRHPAMYAAALMGLNESIHRALELATKWQKRKGKLMHRFFTARAMAKQLRRVQDDILRKMMLGCFVMTASIMEVTFEYTRTTTVRYDGAQPQQVAAEMEIYGSHSTTGGAARSVEHDNEIITMVTTGAEASSTSSSGLTEFSLSETVATHHISENIDGGSGYTIVSKQRMVIKMRMTCEKSKCKTMALVARAAGVESVRIAPDGEDQVVVVGDGVDVVHLLTQLRKKVAPAAHLLAIGPAKQEDEYMTEEEDEYMTEEAQQEPATRWPLTRISRGVRAITAKLSRFMRPRPRSSTTSQAAPSSSPQLLEYTDTPVPAPTTGPRPHLFPGESSSSMTFSAATPPAGIHQYQEHARTSARRAKAGDLFEKPDLLLPQHQPAAPPATAPVRHMRRTFNMSKIHRSVRLPAVRQSRMMPRAKKIETSSFERSGARVLLPLMSCALCALVLLASVWALR